MAPTGSARRLASRSCSARVAPSRAELLGDRGAHVVADVGDQGDLAGELHGPTAYAGLPAPASTVVSATRRGGAYRPSRTCSSPSSRATASRWIDFQVRAIRAILDGKSVIVSAPTGAGKTLVAEFAIHRALAAWRAPRLHHAAQGAVQSEVRRLRPAVRGGPGRHPHRRRQGQCARARRGDDHRDPPQHVLHRRASTASSTVVLDECHYMGDEGAGTVWEEIIVNAPKDARWSALSATVRERRRRSPTGSASSTGPSRPSRTRIARCRCSTSWPTSPAEIHAYDAVARGQPCVSSATSATGRLQRPRPLVHAAGGGSHRDARRAGRAAAGCPPSTSSSAAPGCERAMETRAGRGQAAAQRAPSSQRGGRRHPRSGRRDARPSRSRRSTRRSSRRCGMGVGLHHAGILPSVKRLIEHALRARALPAWSSPPRPCRSASTCRPRASCCSPDQAHGPRLPQRSLTTS